jgi:hypothetical protein
MNERIQELAYLAEDYADSIVDQGGEFHTTYTEKLAELIIKDCLSDHKERIATRYQGSDYDRAVAYGMEIVYYDIVEKFGVE